MILILGLLAHFQGAITSPSVGDHEKSEILVRVNPVTFIIRPGGEASSELLWNDAELKSFVFHKMDADQPQISWFQEQTLQAICYKAYGCCLKQTTINHILWAERFLTSLPFNSSTFYILYYQWWKKIQNTNHNMMCSSNNSLNWSSRKLFK